MKKLSQSNTILLIICLMYLILYVDRVNISTVAPLIKADLALSNTQIGLALSAFAYPYAAFQLIGGYLGDKFGARVTLTVSVLIVSVATAATALVGSLTALFIARVTLGIGEAPPFPPRPEPWRLGYRRAGGALHKESPIHLPASVMP